MARSPRSVRHLLHDKPTLQRLSTELTAQQTLLADVRRCLPDDLATQCASARLREGTLVLHANSATWATRLRFLAPELISVLETEYPALRDIKVRLLTAQPSTAGRRSAARRSSDAAVIIHNSAEHASSEALRQSLQRLARAVRPTDEP